MTMPINPFKNAGMRVLTLTLLFTAIGSAQAAPKAIITGNESLRNELKQAIERGADWLVKNQAEAGSWSTPEQPAVTALALVALRGQEIDSDEKPALAKGYEFVEKHVQADGSVHGGKGLVNYNTSLALLAFAAAGSDEYRDEIVKARKYLSGTQIDLEQEGELDSPFDGGVGYGSNGKHSDMANTLQALEALYYTKQFESDSGTKSDLNWKAAIHFLENCQNLPSHNKQDWVADDPANKGGFIYHPGRSNAGETNLNGRVALRSYGSISYAGLLSYIYADLDKSDPRVKAVLDWLKENYTLEENPGMGAQGLYYYYHTMAKALTAAGVDEIPAGQGKGAINWREQLALHLLNLQSGDGSWQNENGRWWEKDPALVTSYAMLTLEMIASRL